MIGFDDLVVIISLTFQLIHLLITSCSLTPAAMPSSIDEM